MDKARAKQLYNLADSLSKIDESTLSEQQLSEREHMISRLKEELSKLQEKSRLPSALFIVAFTPSCPIKNPSFILPRGVIATTGRFSTNGLFINLFAP